MFPNCLLTECNGSPISNNQNTVLRLLVEEKDVLLDFTCDYSHGSKNLDLPQSVSTDDPRKGKDRIALMLEMDHQLKIHSLLKYHMTGLRLLGMCAAGKNQTTKDSCSQIPEISLQKCIDTFLDLDQKKDGSREEGIDADVIYYVQRPYLRIIANVYLTSLEQRSFKDVQRWWPAAGLESQTPKWGVRQSIMEEFLRCLHVLYDRLKHHDTIPNTMVSLQDSFGSDLSLHVGIVLQIIQALVAFFLDHDCFSRGNMLHDSLVKDIGHLMPDLNFEFCRFQLEEHIKALMELKYALGKHNFGGIVLLQPDVESEEVERTVESYFSDNWDNFRARVALELKIDPNPSRSMIGSIRDLAPVFGSKKTMGNSNYEHLKTLINVTSAPGLDPSLQLTGLRIITSILFLQPNNKFATQDMRDSEWHRFVSSQEPGCLNSEVSFSELQDVYAEMDAVQTIINCVQSTYEQNVQEALRLGVILLANGRESIQNDFLRKLSIPSSQTFFQQLQRILQKSIASIKESIPRINESTIRSSAQTTTSIQHVVHIFTLMRRLFMGQHRAAQEFFRGA